MTPFQVIIVTPFHKIILPTGSTLVIKLGTTTLLISKNGSSYFYEYRSFEYRIDADVLSVIFYLTIYDRKISQALVELFN